MLGIEGLTPPIFSVFAIIVFMIILFVTEAVRVDVVACLVLVLLGLTQLVPHELLFSGFSSDAVIALIGIMIIGRGLESAGVINAITHWILEIGGTNEHRIRLLLMSIGGLLSGLLRSVGTVALFLPIVTRIRRTTGIAKANLLMPLAFCALIGSTLTMVGSGPLILLNSLLKNLNGLRNAQGLVEPQLGLFFVFPVGLVLLAVGILYFSFFGKWLLPNVPKKRTAASDTMDYFKRMYGIGDDFFEVKVPGTSSLSDSSVNQWETLLPQDIMVVGLRTHDKVQFPPLRKDEIKTGSVVLLLGPQNDIETFVERFGLKLSNQIFVFKERINALNAGLCEAVVPPSSPLVGRDFKELHMRRHYSAQVLAVLRGNKVIRGVELQTLNLRPGDTLGMLCSWQALSEFEKSPDFVIVTTDYPNERYYTQKAGIAILFTILTFSALVLTHIPPALCLLIGALCMVFAKVLSIDDAYAAVSWKTVFLIAGLLPLGSAFELSGATAWLTNHFLTWFSDLPVLGIEFLLALTSVIFSLLMSNVGSTILLVPLAVTFAQSLNADPRLFALIIAINASNAFLLPTNQANALISGPGRYEVSDFVKTGAPLTILYIITSIFVLNLMFYFL